MTSEFFSICRKLAFISVFLCYISYKTVFYAHKCGEWHVCQSSHLSLHDLLTEGLRSKTFEVAGKIQSTDSAYRQHCDSFMRFDILH
jgi:hypothetical protein